ncbi:MAG: hypothetical protein N2544_03640 [Burkholderiales bacterium]|nr:hypothetical protein [Burkholderiales bacterium]
MASRVLRLRRLTAAVTLATFLAACATVPHELWQSDPAARPRPEARTLAVAAPRFTPEAHLEVLLGDPKERAAATGAVAGAGEGLAAWASALSGLRCAGEVCLGVLMVYGATLPVFMAVGALFGAVRDVSQAQTAEALARAEANITAALAELRLQQAAQRALVFELGRAGFAGVVALETDAGPATPGDKASYAGVAADRVVEVSVLGLDIERRRQGGTLVYAPVLRTRGRLVRPADGRVEDEVRYEWRGPLSPAAEWTADRGSRFIAALNIAMNQVAEALAYELLLAWYPPRGAASGARASSLAPPYVLAPKQPPVSRSLDMRGVFMQKYRLGHGDLAYAYADSVQPLLAWEAFPRDFDGLAPGRVTDVVYDLRVFRSEPAGPVFTTGAMVYERTGLAAPEHRVADPLMACARYTWTVRARFRLDGQPRATEWGAAANAWPSGGGLEPWQLRRGANGVIRAQGLTMRDFYYPFRAPTLSGAPRCDG